MDLLANPLVETFVATISNPAVLVMGLLTGLALISGLVARSVEIVEDRVPVRIAAGTRSPVGAHSGPAA